MDPSVIQGKKVAIIGYGSQGHAHALNLLDSGVDVRVGLREGSKSAQTAQEAGLKVMSMDDAAEEADVIMMLVPDETQPKVYEEHIKDHLKPGDTRLRPRLQHPLWLHQGPRGRQRHHVRTQGPGPHRAPPVHRGLRRPRPRLRLPGRHRRRWDIVFSYCWGVGGARSGIIKATFKEETEEDLFGEQAVLCGGLVELVKAGFETLTEAGYPEELAYFEVYHEMKMIVDLMYESGIHFMNYSISNTAEYGEYYAGPQVINAESREAMKKILARIQDGSFAQEFVDDCNNGHKWLLEKREEINSHPIEKTGEKIRSMFSWIKKD